MRLVYIAGPFTSHNDDVVEQNIRRAESVGRCLVDTGLCAVLIPHCIGRRMSGTGSAQYWYDATLEMCVRCDAVMVVPNDGQSIGTKNEIRRMQSLGKPVFRQLSSIIGWLEQDSNAAGRMESKVRYNG